MSKRPRSNEPYEPIAARALVGAGLAPALRIVLRFLFGGQGRELSTLDLASSGAGCFESGASRLRVMCESSTFFVFRMSLGSSKNRSGRPSYMPGTCSIEKPAPSAEPAAEPNARLSLVLVPGICVVWWGGVESGEVGGSEVE